MNNIEEPPVVLKKNYSNHCQLIFNRPKQLNTIDFHFYQAFENGLKMCEKEDDTKFIILKGAGTAFSSGGDIRQIAGCAEELPPMNLGTAIFEINRVAYTIGTVNKPVITYMDGITAGGAVAHAQSSAFKIATEKTVVFIPECQIGHFTDVANSFHMSHLEGHLGVYLSMTGQKLMAEDVFFAGLASHFVHSSELEKLDEKLAQLEDVTLDTLNQTIEEVAVKADHIPYQNTLLGEKMEFIERCFQYNTVEEIIKALEQDSYKLAKQCLRSMRANTPISLKVTLALLRYGADKTFAECLDYEFRAWRTVPLTQNLKEGIGMIFEKKSPVWKPSRLEDIEDNIDSVYLAPVMVAPKYNMDRDFKVSPYKRYLLPTCKDVQLFQNEYGVKAHSEIISWFVKSRNYKYGVKEKVEAILNKRRIPTQRERVFALPRTSQTIVLAKL